MRPTADPPAGTGDRRRVGGRFWALAEADDGEGDEDDDAGDTEAEAPADVVLDVAGDHGGDGGAGAHAEVPPVEEGAPGDGLLGVVLVELVGAERLRAWLVPGLRQRHQVERDVEDGHLHRRRRARARERGEAGAPVRVEHRERRGQGQHAHALQRQTRLSVVSWTRFSVSGSARA